MGERADKLRKVRLKTPLSAEDVAGLRLGDVVYLDGLVYTGREGVYKKVLEQGHDLPAPLSELGNINFHCSPAAAPDGEGGYRVGALSATASFRFDKWLHQWFELTAAKAIIGKGGMKASSYRDVFAPNGAIYLTTVGYGTGALLGRGIKRVRAAHWIEELGLAQAMWVFEVEKFGPFLVESDLEGNSLFERTNKQIAEGLPKLYEGSKPAILRRYGETDDRSDEVV